MTRFTFYSFLIIFFCSAAANSQQKTSHKIFNKNFVPWAVLQKDNKYYCPLCGDEYKPKDFKKLHPKISLSCWHDNNLDPTYFENKIANISDTELLESIDWKKVKIDKSEKEASITIFTNQKDNQFDNRRLFGYFQFDENSFIPTDDYKQLVKNDTAKYNLTIANADAVTKFDFPYGVRRFTFKDKVDFNYNFGESAKYGFHYWTFGNYLTAAYMINGNKKYIEAFDQLFNDWYDQRNAITNTLEQYDVVWYELGIAARIPVFIDAYRLFKNEPTMTELTKARMFKTFLGSGRWLNAALKGNPYHPYNWPIYAAISLCYLSATFPEFKESQEWLKTSKSVMEDHLNNDIRDDGGYLERSAGYNNLAFALFFRYINIIKYFAKDENYYNTYIPFIEKMAQYVMYTNSPLGTACPFNDSQRSNFVKFLYEYAKLFHRSDFLGAVRDFLTNEDIKKIGIKPVFPKTTSINLSDSKFAVMRSGWSKNNLMMIVNYGPAANHNHEDILDFEIYAYGKPIAVDAGIGAKGYDDESHLSWYRTTISHNMIMTNGSAVDRGKSVGENIKWYSQNNIDYFAASHRGYESKFDLINRRHIVFVKPLYWIVFDSIITKNASGKLDWLFHSPLTLHEQKNGYSSESTPGFYLFYPENSNDDIKKLKSEGLASVTGLPGETESHRKINYISFQKTLSNNTSENNYGILIFPFNNAKPEINYSQIQCPSGTTAYEIKSAKFTDKIFFSDGKKKTFIDGIETDALFLYLRYEGEKLKNINALESSFCKIGDKSILSGKKRTNIEKAF